MQPLAINISWEFFLGGVGSLIVIAYYASARFTRIETSLEWLTDTLRDLAIRMENISTKTFQAGSPVTLTAIGEHLLEQSGLRSFVNGRKVILLDELGARELWDAYELQDRAFKLFAHIKFEPAFQRHLSQFAFTNGISTDLLRRLAGIYLRDLAARFR